MLKILNKSTSKRKEPENNFDFFALSSSEKKKIVRSATEESNKSQLKIVEEYKKKFGNA